MTRTGIVLVVCLATVGCRAERKEEPAPRPTFTDEGHAAQQRIGAYLQSAVVVDKFRTCWGQLKGPGAVAIDLNYRKSGEDWTFDSARVTKSTLSQAQDVVARQCIEESARGTKFPVDSKQALETAAPDFVVRLGWSVPLPAAGTEMTTTEVARMIGTGGSGGVITISGCSDCASNPNPPYGLKCVTKKSGSNVDCEEISSNVCATTPRACLSGVFGGTRGVIMY